MIWSQRFHLLGYYTTYVGWLRIGPIFKGQVVEEDGIDT
jgi:hypothetical protein